MAVIRVPVTITYPGTGGPATNVWSLRVEPGAFVFADELAAGMAALRTFYNDISDQFPPGAQVISGADMVDRETQQDVSIGTTTINSTATATSYQSAPVLAIVIGWRTSLRARRGMGRTFVGPLKAAAVDTNGTPTQATLDDIAAAATKLRDASTAAAGWSFGVWGLQNKGQYDANGVLIPGQPHVHRDFTSFKIRDQFAVMRSRRD